MNLSNGGRLSKREIHYQFLKREKDPNKTLNKYFVPWFHQKLYHGFTTSTPPNGHISISLNSSLSCDFLYLPFTLSIVKNERVTQRIVIRQWLIEWKGHITFWRRGCNEIKIQLLERWEICFPFCTGLLSDLILKTHVSLIRGWGEILSKIYHIICFNHYSP